MSTLVLSLTLLFAGLLALLYAAGKLAARSVSYEARLMAAAYLALAMMLCHAAALISGILAQAPHWLGWHIPGLLAIGPLIYRFTQVRLNLPGRNTSWQLHLAPALLSIPGLLLFLFVDSPTKLALIGAARAGILESTYLIIVVITSLHPVAYALIGIIELIRALGWRRYLAEESVRLLGVLLVALGLMSLLLLVGFIGQNRFLLSVGTICSALFIPALYILGRRYPYFFDELQSIVERSKYQNSQLKGKDLAEIGRRLNSLMSSEKLYRDEELSLADLAASVQLTSHQLSEYFNVQLKVNFSRFVNRYRIQEACKMLIEHPELTVLNIAFAVGFNSKSVFNTAFSRETGLTPTAYRAKHPDSTPIS